MIILFAVIGLSVVFGVLTPIGFDISLWWAIPLIVLWYIALFVLYLLILFVISLFVNLKKETKKRSRFFRFVTTQTVVMILKNARVHIKTSGLEKLDGVDRFLIVANHKSNFDPFISIAACPKAELAYICKPSIFKIPIVGSFVHKCFFIPIDRDNNREALKTIKRAANFLEEKKVSIGVYPEGTRNKDEGLLPFKNGAFKIATRVNAPIVIASTNSTEKIAKNFPLKSTWVSFDILRVIYPEEYQSMKTKEIGDIAYDLISEKIKEYNK